MDEEDEDASGVLAPPALQQMFAAQHAAGQGNHVWGQGNVLMDTESAEALNDESADMQVDDAAGQHTQHLLALTVFLPQFM